MTFTNSNAEDGSAKAALPIPAGHPPNSLDARFRRIPYQRRHYGTSSHQGLTLGGRYWVEKGYFELAWGLVWAHFSHVDWTRKQSAESLCNDPDWQDRRRGDRLKLGRCIKYFADQELLPIWVCNPGQSGKRKYLLIACDNATHRTPITKPRQLTPSASVAGARPFFFEENL